MCAPEYVFTLHACKNPWKPERGRRFPELEVQVVVNHHEGAQNQTRVLCKEQELLTFAWSIQPAPSPLRNPPLSVTRLGIRFQYPHRGPSIQTLVVTQGTKWSISELCSAKELLLYLAVCSKACLVAPVLTALSNRYNYLAQF